MEPLTTPHTVTIGPDAPIRDVMEAMAGADDALGVTEDGTPLGQITRDGLIAKLLDPRS